MPSYLVEGYVPSTGLALNEAQARARRAAELVVDICYVRTTFLPGDEVLVHVFEAPSAEALDEAGRLASLQFERILDAVDSEADGSKEAERRPDRRTRMLIAVAALGTLNGSGRKETT